MVEPLKDPCKDRAVASVTPPPARPLSKETIVGSNGQYDTKLLQEHLSREGTLQKELLLEIIGKAADILRQEPSLLKLKDPITVVGDIHGQFYDLAKLLEVGGDPMDTQYVFLGDYVDRGSYSVESVALLFALKICNPKRIWLLRGNHECRQMTAFFNFRDECEYKHDLTVYNAFMEAFDCMPLAATVNRNFLLVHGGLSPELSELDQLMNLPRFGEPPTEGLVCDLIWSDPMETLHEDGPTPLPKEKKWVSNEARGCSYFFSYDAVCQFLRDNSLLSVIRAHEAEQSGYRFHRDYRHNDFRFPAVITLFSAPNYCDVYGNNGAIIKFKNNVMNVLEIAASPHPYHLCNFMGVLEWSMPFVIEKVADMIYGFLNDSAEESDFVEDGVWPDTLSKIFSDDLNADQNQAVGLALSMAQELHKKGSPADAAVSKAPLRRSSLTKDDGDRLRAKVRNVGRLAKAFKVIREEHETQVQLGGVCPADKLSAKAVHHAKTVSGIGFSHAKGLDCENERRPHHGATLPAAQMERLLETS